MFLKAFTAIAAISLSGIAAAQTTTTTGTTTDPAWRMPYEKGFWGHAGASIGGTRLRADCPSGVNCDNTEQALRFHVGGTFNRNLGAEVGYLKLGDFSRGGGEIDSDALDLAFIAGIPFGSNSMVFAKLGGVHAWTKVTADSPAVDTGKANGWGPRGGLGLQLGLNRNWALRVDADRYRIRMPGMGRENVDTLTVGAQYTFGAR